MASGRNLTLVKKVIDEEQFPLPDFIICSVGTEIYYTNGKDYILDKGWAKFLAGRWKRDDIVNRLKEVKWIKLQEENLVPYAMQDDFKIEDLSKVKSFKGLSQFKNDIDWDSLFTVFVNNYKQ